MFQDKVNKDNPYAQHSHFNLEQDQYQFLHAQVHYVNFNIILPKSILHEAGTSCEH